MHHHTCPPMQKAAIDQQQHVFFCCLLTTAPVPRAALAPVLYTTAGWYSHGLISMATILLDVGE